MASHRISSAASDATYSSCASDSDVESNATSTYDTTPNVSYHDGELIWTGDGDVEKVVRLKDEEVVTVMKTRGGGYQIFTIPPPEMSLNNQPFELSTIYIANLPQAFFDKHAFAQLPAWLDPALGNEVHILISTLSGTGLAPAFFDSILPPILKATGLDEESYKVIRTDSAESVKDFATSVLLAGANQGRKQTVLMLSGDGGMVDTINGLLEFGERSSSYIKPILAQLPLGTGNALFHSLHRTSTVPSITSPYIQGLRTLLYGSPKPLPLLSTTFSPGARLLSNEGQTATPILNDTLYGAVVASYGLHATLVADSDTTAYRKHGRDRFGIAANNLLFPEGGALPHAYKADVSLLIGEKREPIQRDTHGYVLATLVSNLEKGFTINPDSKPLDGQLRVVHFGATSGAQAMEVMKAAYGDGKHVGMEWEGEQGEGTMKVGYEAVDGVRIDFKEEGENWKWRRCCVDGLIVGVEEGGWMEIRKVKDGKECVDVVVDL